MMPIFIGACIRARPNLNLPFAGRVLFMLRKISQVNDVIFNLRHGISYDLKPYRKILEDINSVELRSCSDARIKEMAAELKRRAAGGIDADQLLVEAFALVREASRRTLGLFPFDVQVMAGIALHSGKIVEMQTGEGKTLAAVMPAYLNALSGKGCISLPLTITLPAGMLPGWDLSMSFWA